MWGKCLHWIILRANRWWRPWAILTRYLYSTPPSSFADTRHYESYCTRSHQIRTILIASSLFRLSTSRPRTDRDFVLVGIHCICTNWFTPSVFYVMRNADYSTCMHNHCRDASLIQGCPTGFQFVDLSRFSERMLLILYFVESEAGKAHTIVTPSIPDNTCLQNDIGPSARAARAGWANDACKLKLICDLFGGETTSRRSRINLTDSCLV